MLCHSVMHACVQGLRLIMAGHAAAYGPGLAPPPPVCGCKCATRACVMGCVRARKDYSRRCLGRRGKARRRRGMIRAPCVTRARPAGRPAGGGPGWALGVGGCMLAGRGRGPRARGRRGPWPGELFMARPGCRVASRCACTHKAFPSCALFSRSSRSRSAYVSLRL